MLIIMCNYDDILFNDISINTLLVWLQIPLNDQGSKFDFKIVTFT